MKNIKQMNKFSIIIPVYNTQKEFLKKCIESAITQSYSNVEIIIIDDGSDLKTKEELKRYRNIENVKIIEQNNSGVSAARNIGIEKAQGNYLIFLDSDDYLLNDTCKIYDDIINNNKNSELIISKNNVVNSECEFLKENTSEYFEECVVCNKEELIYSLFLVENAKYTSIDTPWAKAYNVDFLRKSNIKFKENLKNGEDGVFVLETIVNTSNIFFTPKVTYNYRINEYSTCNTFFKDLDDRFILLINEYEKVFKKYDLRCYDELFNRYVLRIICRLIRKFYFKINSYNIFKSKIEKIYTNEIMEKVLDIKSSLKIGQKIIVLMLKYRWNYGIFLLSKLKLKIK